MAPPDEVMRYADRFSAMGAEPRLRILRLLLSAHPGGTVLGDIQTGFGIPGEIPLPGCGCLTVKDQK
ncbi:MAG TPA: hypothetical protein VFQ91_11355 [Bryobacteraceae bacterium]|nr:hypothetical protein [Bryobacteraceae bacterium]